MPTKAKKEPEKELQTKYIQYQLLRQQLTAFSEEKALIDEKINELNATIDALHKLEDAKKGGEIWSPLGSGSFVRSDIKDVEKVMIAIGAGAVVRETRERAIEIFQGRLEELNKLQSDILRELEIIARTVQRLEPELEMLAHKVKHE